MEAKRIFDIYFCGTYHGYEWAYSAEGAIKKYLGEDFDEEQALFYTAVESSNHANNS